MATLGHATVTAIKDIVDHAQQNNVDGSSFVSTVLGEIVQDVWGEMV